MASVAATAPRRRARITGLLPPVGDTLVAAVFVLGSLAEALFSETVRSPVLHASLAGTATAALAWRRRYPLSVAAAVMASNIAINPEGQFSTLLAMVLVSFTLGAELDPPRSWFGLGLVSVPFITAMVLDGLEPSDVGAALVFLAGPWGVGLRCVSERPARLRPSTVPPSLSASATPRTPPPPRRSASG